MTRILQITDDKTPVLASLEDVSIDEIRIDFTSLSSDSPTGKVGKGSAVGRIRTRQDRLREFRSKCREPYDLVVVPSFGSAYSGPRWKRIAKSHYEGIVLGQLTNALLEAEAPVAVIDYADDYTIHPVNRPLLEACDVYFKRELAIDKWRSLESLNEGASRSCSYVFRENSANRELAQKLEPITLGLGAREGEAIRLKDEMGAVDKRYDVFYVGGGSSRPMRGAARDQLLALDGEVSIHAPDGALSFPEYVRAIAESWLCLSPPGLGWDCYRHYEALFFGSIPVIARPDILLQVPFEDGRNAVVYDPEEAVGEIIRSRVKDKGLLQGILDAQATGAGEAPYSGAAKTRHVLSRTLGRGPMKRP